MNGMSSCGLQVLFCIGFFASVFGVHQLASLAAPLGPGIESTLKLVGPIGMAILYPLVAGLIGTRLYRAHRNRRIVRENLSAAWQRKGPRPVDVELLKPSLAGFRLGDDIQRFSFLGPAEEAERVPDGFLDYPSSGLCLQMKEGRLTGFEIEVEPFSKRAGGGSLLAGGSKLQRSSREADLVAALGAPFWRAADEKDGEVTLYFELSQGEGWVEIQAVLASDGQLERLFVYDTPMLADPELREQLEAAVDWPPVGAPKPV